MQHRWPSDSSWYRWDIHHLFKFGSSPNLTSILIGLKENTRYFDDTSLITNIIMTNDYSEIKYFKHRNVFLALQTIESLLFWSNRYIQLLYKCNEGWCNPYDPASMMHAEYQWCVKRIEISRDQVLLIDVSSLRCDNSWLRQRDTFWIFLGCKRTQPTCLK